MKKSMIGLVILALGLTGCVGSQDLVIIANGKPLPENVLKLKNNDTQITAYVYFVRSYKKWEGKEFAIWQEYLPLGEINMLRAINTESLVLKVHIVNLNKHPFELKLNGEVTYGSSLFNNKSSALSRDIYAGQFSNNVYSIELPAATQNKERVGVLAWVDVTDGENEPLFYIGPVQYKIE